MLNYKFRSDQYFQTIGFERALVNVLDFKKGVISQGNYNNINKEQAFDFAVVDQRTGEEYRDNNMLIPRHTFLVIHQIPANEKRAARLWEPPTNPVVSLLEFEQTLEIEGHEARAASPPCKVKKTVGEIKPEVRDPWPTYICHRCGLQGH